MCDVFICSDSGVGLCEDDRKLLEGLGSISNSSSSKGSCDKKVKFDDIEPASEPQQPPSDKSVVDEIEEGDGNNNKEAEEDRNRQEKESRNNRESVEKVGCAGKILAAF